MTYSSSINNGFRLVILLGLCLVSFSLFAVQFKTTLTKGAYSRQFTIKSETKGPKLLKHTGMVMATNLVISPVSDAVTLPVLSTALEPVENIIAGVLQGADNISFRSSYQCLIMLNEQNTLYLSGFLGVNSLGALTEQLTSHNVQNLFIPELFSWHPVTFVQVVELQSLQTAQATLMDVTAETGVIEVTTTVGMQVFNLTIQINFVGNELVMTLFEGHAVDLESINNAPVVVA